MSQDTSSGSAPPQADLEVDASGLKCPLPILRAKKALAQLESGQVLKVVTTDTHAIRDFQAFAKQTGNVLEAQLETGEGAVHFLRRR
ncbi:sulfurtransferase TusA family protein [Alcaligenaceae bacterium]|uniref:sulfurtransferase TusA family protein n=1 Tax=Parapusillimonas sp. JC17 TaxID=3445768 RepID=UPI0015D34B92|nr:sulfurtransferase TusA family protein [Alcaligenaceae bacterium]